MNDALNDLLKHALAQAADNHVALFIVLRASQVPECLNTLARLIPQRDQYKVRYTPEALYVGERGSVRFYTSEHPQWDAKNRLHRGYPAGTPTFLHSEV